MSGQGTGETIRLFARFVERSLGLHFPEDRLGELQSKLAPLCRRAGFQELNKYLLWLMAAPLSPTQLETLAAGLTIGETYFLRDPNSFRVLEERLLPELIPARRREGKRLRIWSAGCSSGEEPYSIAILLSRAIPDLADWQLDLLATDLNPQALERARTGVYGQWSFRNAPEWLMEYFTARENRRYELLPRIRQMVRFQQLNLADPQALAAVTAGGRMDIIFCRNVMLYFDAERITSTMTAFNQALVDGGWLFVGATELNYGKLTGFSCLNLGGALVLRKLSAREAAEAAKGDHPAHPARHPASGWGRGTPPGGARRPTLSMPSGREGPSPSGGHPAGKAPSSAAAATDGRLSEPAERPGGGHPPPQRAQAAAANQQPVDHSPDPALELFRSGRYREAAERAERSAAGREGTGQAESLALAARAWANLGNLPRARECCERAIACERLSAASHYLLSIILEQQGELDGALRSLKHALFIDHDYLLAYFALGNIHRLRGERQESERNFVNALRLLERRPADEVLEEAEGLTAGRLAQLVKAMLKAGKERGKGER
ncbi:CheR family methyltransferase [Geomonas sp.]|uniref:CheR family methyltransferase n=1 Tax=Geomonas sp. TaxID=2651584 RepID=UPI002B45B094|nr:CheR family methyltransferase [Geomonas sp.]HJV33945.1 CheR family methyltransferase [Geomonas sp.]